MTIYCVVRTTKLSDGDDTIICAFNSYKSAKNQADRLNDANPGRKYVVEPTYYVNVGKS